MIYHERLSKMSNEELIKEAREYATEVGGNYEAELLEGLADRLEAERGHIQSLAKWVDVAEDASSIDITCEASAALEAATPVQVDEAKLAELLKKHRQAVYEWAEGDGCLCGVTLQCDGVLKPGPEEVAEHISSVVAEWLRGGGQ